MAEFNGIQNTSCRNEGLRQLNGASSSKMLGYERGYRSGSQHTSHLYSVTDGGLGAIQEVDTEQGTHRNETRLQMRFPARVWIARQMLTVVRINADAVSLGTESLAGAEVNTAEVVGTIRAQ